MNLSKRELKDIETRAAQKLLEIGKFIMSHWHKIEGVSFKDGRDIVTNVDVEAENLLRSHLTRIFPDAGFIVEEGKTVKKSRYNWVIDPIDGTKQYISQLPIFKTQIALLYNDKPILGCVYNPVSAQLFSASLGNGAYLNGKKLGELLERPPHQAIIDVDFGGISETIEERIRIFSALAKKFYRIRIFAGIFSIYIVTGAFDATLSVVDDPKIYDVVPHDIITTETGIAVEYLHVPHMGRIRMSGTPRCLDTIREVVTSVQ